MFALKISAEIEHDTGKKVKYKRKTHCQKRRVDKKQADLRYRDIKTLAYVGAYAE
jgi:hypothetical protein